MIGRRNRQFIEQLHREKPGVAAGTVIVDVLGSAGRGRLRRANQRAAYLIENANGYLTGIVEPLRRKVAKYDDTYSIAELQPAYPAAVHLIGLWVTLLGELGLGMGIGLVLNDPLDPTLFTYERVIQWALTVLTGLVFGGMSFTATVSMGKTWGYFIGRLRGSLLPATPKDAPAGSGVDTTSLGDKARRALLATLVAVLFAGLVGLLFANKPREALVNTASFQVEWWTLALASVLLATFAGLADGFYQAREVAAIYSTLCGKLRRAVRRGMRRHALARRYQAAAQQRGAAAAAHVDLVAGRPAQSLSVPMGTTATTATFPALDLLPFGDEPVDAAGDDAESDAGAGAGGEVVSGLHSVVVDDDAPEEDKVLEDEAATDDLGDDEDPSAAAAEAS